MQIKTIKRHYLRKVQKQNRLNLTLEKSIKENNASKGIFDTRKEEHKQAVSDINKCMNQFEDICDSDGLQRFLNSSVNYYRYNSSYEDRREEILRTAPNFEKVLKELEKEKERRDDYESGIRELEEKNKDLNSKLELAKTDLGLAIKSMKQENVELRLLLRKAAHLENADNLVKETELQLETLDGDIMMIDTNPTNQTQR